MVLTITMTMTVMMVDASIKGFYELEIIAFILFIFIERKGSSKT